MKYANPRTDNDDETDSALATNRGEESSLTVAAGTKRGASINKEGEGDGGGDGSAKKKLKTETFRQKEKRKRDVGQSSRGKSYVEEEKRILRQAFATDEVMS